jgi:dienelactone hydrolase
MSELSPVSERPRLRPLLNLPGGKPVENAEQWREKAEEIRGRIQPWLGKPSEVAEPASGHRVLEQFPLDELACLELEYDAGGGEKVRAYLLLPPEEKRRNGAAVVCLHGTSPEGKEGQIGRGSKPGRDYARFLAGRGYITLAPDHICAGERIEAGQAAYDTAPFYRKHPHWSAVGKAIADGRRAVDILVGIQCVDSVRIGAVGHSLGGHGAMFLAAFDERVAACVSSCGLATWAGNAKRVNWARDHWYIYFPALRPHFLENRELPFDLHEFASLVAPRPFLNISGMGDPMYGNNETLGEAGFALHEVYERCGNGEGFANFLFGGAHEVPSYSRELTAAWFDRWLG